MDARKRAEKIARAAWGAVKDCAPWSDLSSSDRFEIRTISEAAVSAAYEIDGVGELVEAAEMSVGADMALNVKANPFNDEVLAAAARVREAMGGGA